MKSFWRLDKKWDEMLSAFEDNGGELTDEMLEVLAINRSDLDETIEEQMSVMKYLAADVELFKADIAKLQQRKESNEKMIQQIRDGIKIAVQKYGIENKLHSGLYKFSIKNTQALVVTDVSQIPTKYLTYKLKTPLSRETQKQLTRLMERFNLEWDESVKKDELKDAVAKGEVINYGFEIKENTSLVVR